MSSADVAVKVFRNLKNEDLRVLQVIETAMSQHEFVSKEQIARFSKLDLARDTHFRLSRLSKLGLIYRITGAYVGYTLNYSGYDCLAINALVKAGVLEAFGKSLGVGKEADVFDALNPKGERTAIKFHRLGRISFRQTRRKRDYTTQRSASWLYQSRLAAEKEFQALKLVYPHKVAVPEPISQNRHVIVMGMIDGAELAEYKEISKPEKVLKQILRNVKKAYLKAGVVHADLSEYNIILKPDMHILIIDWPQYVTREHPNAQELLTRDLKNITRFFERKHMLKVELKEALSYVTGEGRITTWSHPT
ncbi:serine/threonine protein kinase [Candidatus Bathyarchaeota archaeon CG07_land_8_20_14_0_80_47_9]|nr:MAG: serine/threonine protein kinase [Candidatus Bathyarchaeota archaeon CG07_land_8_20_14_0_80_47_9]